MQIQQRVELVVRREQELQSGSLLVKPAKGVLLPTKSVVDPVIAMLAQNGQTRAQRISHKGAANGCFQIRCPQRPEGRADKAVGFLARTHGVKPDKTGGRVATEQRPLRTAGDFDLRNVKKREALEDHILLHHAVHQDRHRLGCGEIEVRIAQPPYVETRRDTAIGALGVDARRARCELQDVPARLGDRIERRFLHGSD